MNAEHEQPETAGTTGAEPAAGETAPTEPQAAGPTLEEQLQATRAERDENLNRFLRSQAELDNYRKRVQRERDDERRYAALSIIRDLLAPLDNLQRAVESARKSGESGNVLQGIELVVQQMDRVLSGHGAKAIPAAGQPFDPHLHEAVQQMPSEEQPPMTILQELERGYTLHDRVVRPSKVIVSAGRAESREQRAENQD
jgi:molecular chaperone GrpE